MGIETWRIQFLCINTKCPGYTGHNQKEIANCPDRGWKYFKMTGDFLPPLPIPQNFQTIPLLGNYPREMKTQAQSKMGMLMFIAALVIVAKQLETITMSFNRRMDDRLRHVRIVDHDSTKKRHELPIHPTTWLNLKGIMLSEGSQTPKATFYMIPFL